MRPSPLDASLRQIPLGALLCLAETVGLRTVSHLVQGPLSVHTEPGDLHSGLHSPLLD